MATSVSSASMLEAETRAVCTFETNQNAEQNVLGQFIPLHYHFQMLQDKQRLEGFRRAMELHIQPGMHVLELGGGTGILSSFAARCGATVTCVERNPELVSFARRTLQTNGLDQQVTVVEGDATEFIPSQPVDVVVCEMLHVALLREKQTKVLEAFKENYLRHWNEELPRFLPEASRLMVQMIHHPFDFDGYFAPLPIFQAPDKTANDGLMELSPLVDYAHIFYDEPISDTVRWRGRLRVSNSGFVSALRFVTQNFLSVESHGDSPTWPNQFLILPIQEPSPVLAGQEIDVEFSYRFGDPIESLHQSIRMEYLPVTQEGDRLCGSDYLSRQSTCSS
ncbi:methyltransferase domain-containing protein [Pirellula sp. SH-Sr6A]|uniref:methyltransferase domain-containing protein n=1 Tax=Pirellula sp. SH-Sr6A TaxID=1632865 RepID=UPI00197C0D6F|nr:methyltransferase domain-containing protein [Pirellula sp. SH-Sr6A]